MSPLQSSFVLLALSFILFIKILRATLLILSKAVNGIFNLFLSSFIYVVVLSESSTVPSMKLYTSLNFCFLDEELEYGNSQLNSIN